MAGSRKPDTFPFKLARYLLRKELANRADFDPGDVARAAAGLAYREADRLGLTRVKSK